MNLSIPLIRAQPEQEKAQPEQEKAQKLKTTMGHTKDAFYITGYLKGYLVTQLSSSNLYSKEEVNAACEADYAMKQTYTWLEEAQKNREGRGYNR